MADNSLSNDSESWTDTAKYFLHRIFARPKMLSYTDLLRWLLDNVDIRDRKFVTRSRTIIGSLRPLDLKNMYKLPEPQKRYDAQCVQEFM